MSEVAVVDYGAGNLLSVVRALEHIGAKPEVITGAADIGRAQSLILPGVGAFGDCMKALSDMGIVGALKDYIRSGRLFLGVCVGMQVMFEAGEEFGEHAGLGILAGRVTRIPALGASGAAHKVPHVGWSGLRKPALADWSHSILESTPEATSVYFVHSYAGIPADPADCLAEVDYGGLSLCAAVRKGNAYGCQFHPEKSGEAGLNILRRFLQLPKRVE